MKLSPLPTATAIANAAERSSPKSKPSNSIKAEHLADMPEDELGKKSDEELKKMVQALQKETKNLKQNLKQIEDASGSGGGGRNRAPSLVVEFNGPAHKQRPSMIAAHQEQIK